MAHRRQKLEGLIARRSVALSDIPAKGTGKGRQRNPGPAGQAVLDFAASENEAESFQFENEHVCRHVVAVMSGFLKAHPELRVKAMQRGLTVYLVRTDRNGTGR